MSPHVTIIAEAGVNHNGSLSAAMALVDAAAVAGADMVKFQTFETDEVVTPDAAMAPYQARALGKAGTQRDMIRRLQLSEAHHRALIAHCAERGIEFLSTPFDMRSLALLADGLQRPVIKLGSGELTNGPLLLAAARTGRRLIVSTGMATLDEVQAALGVLAFGYSAKQEQPSAEAFAASFADEGLRDELARNVVLLHCTTDYPAASEDANLRAMDTLREAFRIPAGYSDHTRGITVAIAARVYEADIKTFGYAFDQSPAQTEANRS